VTAIFDEGVSIHFARQQVSERLSEAKETLPPGVDPVMGPIATGLGEIYMYTVEYEYPHEKGAPVAQGKPGWRKDGSYLTPEDRRLVNELEQHARKRLLTLNERLKIVLEASKDVRQATAFGEAIIILVYFPILALTGVEGKMFHSMALTVIFALVKAFVLAHFHPRDGGDPDHRQGE
jgi:Cu/Ag efflux pump CusA